MVFTHIPKVLTGLLCLLCLSLYSQSTTFQKNYHGIYYASADDILETDDGYLIAGQMGDSLIGGSNALLIHTDKNGNLLWKKTYGYFGNDAFHTIIPANDGGFIAWGHGVNFNPGYSDCWLAKLDNDGNLLWQKTIGAVDSSELANGNIIAMPDGYVVSGISYKLSPQTFRPFVTRVDNNGETMWSRIIPMADNASLGLQYMADGLLYLTGSAQKLAYWRTLDPATGAIVQSHEYKVDDDNLLYNMHRTPEGDHIMTGSIRNEDGGLVRSVGWVQKVNSEGQVIWSKAYKIADRGNSISASAILADGSCILNMQSNSIDNPNLINTALIKIDANGTVIWARNYGNADQYSYFSRLSQTEDGGLMAAGYSRNVVQGYSVNAIWLKTDSLGMVDGCCISDFAVTVQDVSPVISQLPFSSTTFQPAWPIDIASTEIAFGEIQDFCFNRQPMISRTIAFCPGTTVTLGDSTYSQPAIVQIIRPSSISGCDTILTYTLAFSPSPTIDSTIAFCPGATVTLGDSTYSQPGIVTIVIPSTTGACDTLATYTLELLNTPTLSRTFTFCPGETVTLGDSTYSQSGIVSIIIPSATGGCDTLATYTLVLSVPPAISHTITFCPGETVVIGDSIYSQSGITTIIVPSLTVGCDTIATYILTLLVPPVVSRTIAFCPGETVTLGDSIYSQPGVVNIIIPALNGGCDTIATYTLVYANTNYQSTLQVSCPDTISVIVPAGITSAAVEYDLPTATSDCPCPEMLVDLSSGGASGSLFQLGNSTVCYRSEDACGSEKTCCFIVRVEADSIVSGVSSIAVTPTLTVFPNPAANGSILSITGKEIPNGIFLLQDLLGRSILKSQIVDNQIDMAQSNIAAGVYFFKIIADGQFLGSGKISLF